MNKIGMMAVIVTIVVLAGGYFVWREVRERFFPVTEQAESVTGETDDVNQDRDGDGLADLVETLYRTNPNNPDTDGDGASDGDEVAAGRNPTLVEGAGDLSGDVVIGSAVENPVTWTGKYLASLPDDTPRGEILDQTRLEAFVNVNKGEILPALPEGLIQTTDAGGAAAVEAYLNAITPETNPALVAITNQDIEAAWRLSYQSGQREEIEQLVRQLHENVDKLEAVEAPASVETSAGKPVDLVALHTKLVSASHALVNNAELLRDMNEDFVGGLIGAKNIELLGAVFQEIEAEVDALDAEYGF